MFPPSKGATQPVFTILPSGTSTSGTIATHRLVFTHDWALAATIGGIALGIWVVWLLVVRTRKLKFKANVASTEASESSPLLVQYQAPMNLQTYTATLENDVLLCSVCAKLDFYRIILYGIHELEAIPLGSLSSILEKSYQCSFCRLISLYVRRARVMEDFPHIDLSDIECGVYTMICGALRKSPSPTPLWPSSPHYWERLLADTSRFQRSGSANHSTHARRCLQVWETG